MKMLIKPLCFQIIFILKSIYFVEDIPKKVIYLRVFLFIGIGANTLNNY